MKIKISYEYDASYSQKFWAKAPYFFGEKNAIVSVMRGGDSWTEAKENLVAVLRQFKEQEKALIPLDEEVEI